MGESILGTIMIYSNLLAIVLLTAMSGAAYSYFNQDYFFTNCSINHTVFFGCAIGCGILIFLLTFWVYDEPKFAPFFTFPGYIVVVCLFITYTTPKEKDICIANHRDSWYSEANGYYDYQLKYKCCGWLNSTDHGLQLCPSNFNSGCQSVLVDYMTPRINRLLVASCMVLVLMVISYVILYIVMIVEMEDDFFSLIISF